MSQDTSNALVAAIAYAAVTGGTLAWIFLSKQTSVPKTGFFAVAVSARLALVAAAAWLFCCGTGVSLLYALLIALGLLIFVFLMQGPLGAPVGLPILVVGWAIQQFVLGFPDKKQVLLAPEPDAPATESKLQENVGTVGRVVSPLRPLGRVVLEDQAEEYEAVSIDRSFLERGTPVIVRSADKNRLVVAEHAPE